jgi:hypothetical protein
MVRIKLRILSLERIFGASLGCKNWGGIQFCLFNFFYMGRKNIRF